MSILKVYYDSIDGNLAALAETAAAGGRTMNLRRSLFLPAIWLIALGSILSFALNRLHTYNYFAVSTTLLGVLLASIHLLVVFYRSSTFDYERFTGRKLSDAASRFNGGYSGTDW